MLAASACASAAARREDLTVLMLTALFTSDETLRLFRLHGWHVSLLHRLS